MRKQQQQHQQPIPVTNNQPTTTTQSDPIRSYSPSSSNENNNNGGGGGGGGGGGSYEEDADDNETVQLNANGNPIKRRLRANREQLRVLESVFEQNRTPSPGFKKDLAKKLGMPHKSILYWFQNRRAQLVRSQKQQMKVNQGSETDPQSAAHYQDDGEYEEFDEEERHEESGGPSSFIGNPRNI
ncbi:hypothetical protein HDU78_001667 [Chytriomyces hyalinus]|nr:hypothetical protein HDU78_001667 [Chytriomyces hyalinus]